MSHSLIVMRIAALSGALVIAFTAPDVAPGIPAPGAMWEAAGSWQWPTEAARRVLRPFLAPAQPWGAGHRGVDLASGEGLRAPASGVVRYAGWVVDRPVISIDHGDVVSSYEPVTANVAAGDAVEAGQVIGTVEPGHCAARCVHMGVRVDGDETAYRNPLLWLGGVPRSVLLPTRSVE